MATWMLRMSNSQNQIMEWNEEIRCNERKILQVYFLTVFWFMAPLPLM